MGRGAGGGAEGGGRMGRGGAGRGGARGRVRGAWRPNIMGVLAKKDRLTFRQY